MNTEIIFGENTRVGSAYTRTVLSGLTTPPDQLRGLILKLDLIAASFAVNFNERVTVTLPESDLIAEVVRTAEYLGAIPSESHDDLAHDLELALAVHAPVECITHIARNSLWLIDPPAWSSLMGIILRGVSRVESRRIITAVVVNQLADCCDGLAS